MIEVRSLRTRAFRWSGILGAYFSAQGLVQVTGMLTGFLLVRYLPVREFALYSLATSCLMFFSFFSDLGSTSSLLYFFRSTRERPDEFRCYLDAVLDLRRVAFGLGCVAVLTGFPVVSMRQGFGFGEALVAAGAILLGVWFQISGSVRLLALRLESRFRRSYTAEVVGSLVRLTGAAALFASGLPMGALAILSNSLGGVATAVVANPRTLKSDQDPGENRGRYRRDVLRYLMPSLPSALYFSIQGPLIVWLAATFGSTRNIAEVSALGRLGMLVGICSGLTGTVFLPRLANLTDEKIWRRRYLAFASLLAAIAGVFLTVSILAPRPLLWILGSHYSGLGRELPLVMASACLTLLGGYVIAVNFSRSWNRWEGVAVLILALSQALMVALLPLGTTLGILKFNLGSAAIGLGLQVTITALGCLRPDWMRWMR